MIYLLHFDQPYKHARHYLGFSDDVTARVEAHRCGQGARLMEVIRDAGIGFVLAGVWEGDRKLEHRLHQRGKSRWCPVCSPSYHPRLKRIQ